MTMNLLDILKGYFTNELIGKIGNFLGENENNTRSAVEQILPTLLGGLIAKSSTPAGANSLINMLNDRTHDGNVLGDLMGIFAGGDRSNAFMRMGSSVLGNIFGDKVGGVIDLIAGGTGLRKESSNNLLSFLAPIVLGLLGKTKKDQGLNASGLLSLILGQGSFLKNVLPAGLASILGFSGGIDSLVKTAYSNLSGTYKLEGAGATTSSSDSSRASSTTTHSNTDNDGGGMGWLKWLLPLLLLAALFYFWRGCGKKVENAAQNTVEQVGDAANAAGDAAKNAANAAGDAAQNAANAAGNAATQAWAALGELFKVKLPNGIELNVPKLGVENRLITWISDKTKVVDKTTWFDFDRLLFETNQAVLKPESQEQLKNVAEILKAFPSVEVKIGGYTDNSGDAAKNLKLSQDRANSVMAELVKLGIEAKRMKAEGYGIEHPVADNSTPEGREKNRRVSLRVTKK